MDKDIILTKEQEEKIISFWNSRPKNEPPRLKDIIELVFGNGFDGRSLQGRAVKKFLASRSLKAFAAQEYVSRTASLAISEEAQAFIKNNISKMNSMEMARVIFKNPLLSNLSAEVRAVAAYCQTIPTGDKFGEEKTDVYKPPHTKEQTIARINRYLDGAINLEKISPHQLKCIECTMKHLGAYRFKRCVELFPDEDDKKEFESVFISYVYDKSDLTAEEVDSYINLALDVVKLSNTHKVIQVLTKKMKECVDDSSDESKKLSLSLAQALHDAETEYHQNKTRQRTLIQDLQGKRAERINSQIKANASILNLVGLWRDEQERKRLLTYAKKKEEELRDEAQRLTNVDSLRARICGISSSELLGYTEEK